MEIRHKAGLGPEEQTVTQRFSLDGSRDSNPVLNDRGQLISECLWENGRLVVLGKQVVQDSELIIREEFSLSRQGKRLSILIAGYFRANELNDPKTFTGDDPRWDVIYRQVFTKK